MSVVAKAIKRTWKSTARIAGVDIVYSTPSGNYFINLRAVPDHTDFNTGNDDIRADYVSKDFIVDADELGLVPVKGATITEEVGNKLVRYTVGSSQSTDGSQPFRYTNSFRTHYRIHTSKSAEVAK